MLLSFVGSLTGPPPPDTCPRPNVTGATPSGSALSGPAPNGHVSGDITRPAVKSRSSGVDQNTMQLRPFTCPTPNHWVDLALAAEYADVPVDVIVDAVTNRELRASTAHPDRPGDWMVPLGDVDQWWRRRQLVRAVFG